MCCSMYFCAVLCIFRVVLCIVCVCMCTVQLPPAGYPIAVKYISYHISYHIRSYHICTRGVFHREVVRLYCGKVRQYFSSLSHPTENLVFIKSNVLVAVFTFCFERYRESPTESESRHVTTNVRHQQHHGGYQIAGRVSGRHCWSGHFGEEKKIRPAPHSAHRLLIHITLKFHFLGERKNRPSIHPF
jgi:hypothetical protein